MEHNKFSFEKDSKHPQINFNDGHLRISGNSVAVEPEASYFPLINWMNSYNGKILRIEIDINRINCSSVKMLLTALKAADSNKNIKERSITWFFKDQDELELGDMIFSSLNHSRIKLYCKN